MKQIITLAFTLFFSLSASAAESIQFTQKDLDAAFVLLKADLNSVELNANAGVFHPAPSLQFLGVEKEEFDIDLKGIANLADIRFNQVKVSTPQVSFTGSSLQITLPVSDQASAIQSRLGSISFKGVSVNAAVGFKTLSNGSQQLTVLSTQVSGSLSGSGVLRSSFVLGKVRNLIANTLFKQLQKIVNKPAIQSGLSSGLLGWSGLSVGREVHSITARSIEFFTAGSVNGLRFKVE